jgi:hypothetical protein
MFVNTDNFCATKMFNCFFANIDFRMLEKKFQNAINETTLLNTFKFFISLSLDVLGYFRLFKASVSQIKMFYKF